MQYSIMHVISQMKQATDEDNRWLNEKVVNRFSSLVVTWFFFEFLNFFFEKISRKFN